MKITIYTDGACNSGKNEKGATNKGGWGCVVLNEDNVIINLLHGFSENTTNNREELKAVLNALEYAQHLDKTTDGGVQLTIVSDSAYAVNMCKEGGWIYSWERNNWRKGGNKPIENLDLVQSIFKSLSYFNYNKNFLTCKVDFVHVRGHAASIENEIADALATHNTRKIEKILGRNPQLMGVNINEVM